MSTAIFVLGILFLTVVAPLWIVFHYITRWKAMKGLTPEDEKMLGDLWESAQRLEDRIAMLERATGMEAERREPHRDGDRPEGAMPRPTVTKEGNA